MTPTKLMFLKSKPLASICVPTKISVFRSSRFETIFWNEVDDPTDNNYRNFKALIVDEVYREFIHAGNKHYSVLQHPKGAKHTVMIDSVSKRYSLCGARVGCIITKNKDLIKNVKMN